MNCHYSSLPPFCEMFARGNPVLTYHKLGQRPPGARLKGLYLSTELFSRQLRELQEAGFGSGALNDCAGPHRPERIVITFDDGYVNVLQHGLKPLAAHHFKAIQFLPANLLGKCNEWDVTIGEAPEAIMSADRVREWLAAGHDIGSHTLTHPFLTRLPPGRAREEIFASKKKLEDLFGRPILHFCYPYGEWNTPVRDLVIEAGYKTACTTNSGINDASTSPFELKRITARYPSRNLKAFAGRLRRTWHRLASRAPTSVV